MSSLALPPPSPRELVSATNSGSYWSTFLQRCERQSHLTPRSLGGKERDKGLLGPKAGW